jgi:hypothetical protein
LQVGQVKMLDLARPETRLHVRSHPSRLGWGIVDVVLAVVMLPFGIWMFVIERAVMAVASLESLSSRR